MFILSSIKNSETLQSASRSHSNSSTTIITHVHVDTVGPLPTSRWYTYILTILDRTTRWSEAVPLQDITAASCARAFMTGWIARFGVPLQMTSDRGRQFISSLGSEMARSLGTQLHRTTSYHPQANGMVERFHRSLKASLRARLQQKLD